MRTYGNQERRWFTVVAAVFITAFAIGCSDDDDDGKKDDGADAVSDAGGGDVAAGDAAQTGDTVGTKPIANKAAHAKLTGVKKTNDWKLKGLHAPVQVIRTEGSVPHIYAGDSHDLAFAQGFIVARDRYFFVLLGSLLGQGRISEYLGEEGLGSDYESRAFGMTHVAATLLKVMTEEQKVTFDAFARGINAYVDLALAKKLPLPSEINLLAPLLSQKPKDLMRKFERRDVAGFAAVLVYQLGFETGDIGRGHSAKGVANWFKGKAHEALRKKGAIEDLYKHIAPATKFSSAHGWKTETADGKAPPPPPNADPKGPGAGGSSSKPGKSGSSEGDFAGSSQTWALRVPAALLKSFNERVLRFQKRIGRDHEKGFGSNAWAVGKTASKDGKGVLAGDGHLPLTIPSYFYQLGLDTAVIGGGDTHQVGLVVPGVPIMAVGTNGFVAWCQTQLFGDITDWYAEELQLDANGAPARTRFKGAWKDVAAKEESFKVAELKSVILPSKGGTEKWQRYVTFDGRWITEIEGKKVKKGHKPEKGETVVNLGGKFIIPGDTNKDGKITAFSFDYTGLDEGNMLLALDGFGHSKDVSELRQAMKHLVAYSQNIVAADADGSTFYSGYQAVPCRKNLPRKADGSWQEGADPSSLLDGTKYGGFTVPIKDGKVDEGPGKTDASKCVVPFDEYPQALNPKQNYVVTANNDIGDITHDNSLTNDKWYVGGPWMYSYRAQRIADRLDHYAKKGATVDDMVQLQADVKSTLGTIYSKWLVKVVNDAKALSENDNDKSVDEARVVKLYEEATAVGVADAVKRLAGWEKLDYAARSGVETFYHKPDAADREAAVATTILQAWYRRFEDSVFQDEPMPGVWRFSGGVSRANALQRLVNGIGPKNPGKLTSWYDKTGQSIFFDVLGTAQVETAEELALKALVDTLKHLRSAPPADPPGSGGFGTADMSKWLWGLRHLVKFESTIADFFSAAEGLSALTDQFAITTETLPLMGKTKLDKKDPRKSLKWFPRHGDPFAVDAAGGTSTTKWHYGSGPVFRMVIAMTKKDGKPQVDGYNIVPGGQSALTDSDYFSDQAAMWLGNKALPLRFDVDQVVAGAIGREVLTP